MTTVPAFTLTPAQEAAFAALAETARQFAAAITAWGQALCAAIAPIVRRFVRAWAIRFAPCATALRRDQFERDLLWLWLPAPAARRLATHWPRRYLPALRL